jgi:hypothetical protein
MTAARRGAAAHAGEQTDGAKRHSADGQSESPRARRGRQAEPKRGPIPPAWQRHCDGPLALARMHGRRFEPPRVHRRRLRADARYYDRIGHFAQGFVPALVVREVVVRRTIIRGAGWTFFFALSVCGMVTALYEIVEWLRRPTVKPLTSVVCQAQRWHLRPALAIAAGKHNAGETYADRSRRHVSCFARPAR